MAKQALPGTSVPVPLQQAVWPDSVVPVTQFPQCPQYLLTRPILSAGGGLLEKAVSAHPRRAVAGLQTDLGTIALMGPPGGKRRCALLPGFPSRWGEENLQLILPAVLKQETLKLLHQDTRALTERLSWYDRAVTGQGCVQP